MPEDTTYHRRWLTAAILGKGRPFVQHDLHAIGSGIYGDIVPLIEKKPLKLELRLGNVFLVNMGFVSTVPLFVAKATVTPPLADKSPPVDAPEAVALSKSVCEYIVAVTVVTAGARDDAVGVTRLDTLIILVAFSGAGAALRNIYQLEVDDVASGQKAEISPKKNANTVEQSTSAEAHFISVMIVVQPRSAAVVDMGRLEELRPIVVSPGPE